MPHYIFTLSTRSLDDTLYALLAGRFHSVQHGPHLRFEIWTIETLTKLELCQVVVEIQPFLRESLGILGREPINAGRGEAAEPGSHWSVEETEEMGRGSPWSKTTPPGLV